jgi:catechol 2,3-dioxygenase-like lactoylglutathione lyase family enzyme
MEASAISHIAICTRDMDKALAFYRDMLGMRVLFDGMTDPTEE